MSVSRATRRATLIGLLAAGAAVPLACGGSESSPSGPEPGAVTRVEISPREDTIEVGEPQQWEATARDANGNVVERTIHWSSTNRLHAIVRSDGTVVGKGVGEADIVARAGDANVADTAHVVVVAPPIAEVELSPRRDTVDVGGGRQFEATARDSSGREVDAPLQWRSLEESVAVVDSGGKATGQAVGEAGIVARAGSGAADTATLVVRQIASDLTARALQLRPRGVLVDSTTTADVVIANTGGHVEATEWRIRSGGTTVAEGEVTPPRPGEVDTFAVENIGGFSAGQKALRLEVDPHDRISESDEADNDTTTYLAVRPPGFDIELQFRGNPSEAFRDSARAAADRVEEVITGDLPDVTPTHQQRTSCRDVDLEVGSEPVDDVVVVIEPDTSLDVNGKALPCARRDQDAAFDQIHTPIWGHARIDPGTDGITRTMAHEMAHVLGLVGNGNQGTNIELKVERPQEDDWVYVGPMGVHQYRALGGDDPDGAPMRDPSHWAGYGPTKWDFMTSGEFNITRVSVGALADVYYSVDFSAADENTAN